MLKHRKQFCKHGHDTFITGRYNSGLHVIWNLQYLTIKENKKKGNKWVKV